MIFKETWQQVLDGTKTQTRRPVKDGDEGHHILPRGGFLSVEHNGRLKWALGFDYAVQPGRGKKAVGRIRITGIWRQRLREIWVEECRAEGITGVFARFGFEQLWNSLYRKPYRWEDNPEVWVLEFERAGTYDAKTD